MNSPHLRLSVPVATWLLVGATSFIPHLVAVVSATLQRPGFDHKRQFLSELGERGSSTANVFNFLGVIPTGILILIFGLGLVYFYRHEMLLKIAGVLVSIHGAFRVAAAVFPCDAGCRPEYPTSSQVNHNAVATGAFIALTVALFIVGVWLIKRREGIATIVVTYVLGAVAVGMQVWLTLGTASTTGLAQRMALAALQLWIVALSAHLYHRARTTRTRLSRVGSHVTFAE